MKNIKQEWVITAIVIVMLLLFWYNNSSAGSSPFSGLSTTSSSMLPSHQKVRANKPLPSGSYYLGYEGQVKIVSRGTQIKIYHHGDIFGTYQFVRSYRNGRYIVYDYRHKNTGTAASIELISGTKSITSIYY